MSLAAAGSSIDFLLLLQLCWMTFSGAKITMVGVHRSTRAPDSYAVALTSERRRRRTGLNGSWMLLDVAIALTRNLLALPHYHRRHSVPDLPHAKSNYTIQLVSPESQQKKKMHKKQILESSPEIETSFTSTIELAKKHCCRPVILLSADLTG